MYFKLALGNVRKSLRDYAIYFLTLVFGVCVFYAFNSITQQTTVLQMSETQNKILDLLSGLIGGVSVFIAVILGFLVVYASRYLIRRRKKEFGTYLLLGMAKGKVSRVIVYETMLVGFISLVVGLVAGVLLSQGLLYVTAAMFGVTIEALTFLFSSSACIMTIVCFAIIFLVALVFNVISISKYQLIDLINADHISEKVRLRSLPISVVLFILSLIMIGFAYWLLTENGMAELNEQFVASAIIVFVGTALFFYSLSGFLLRAIQANKRLYLRGLNMFTFRQLNSKINTASVSVTIICITLFLALTSTCGGLAICSIFANGVEESTPYDATFTAYVSERDDEGTERTEIYKKAVADDFDIHAALSRDVKGFDGFIAQAGQIDFYESDKTYGDMLDATDYKFSSAFYSDNMQYVPLNLVSLSQFNEQLIMRGEQPVQMAADELMIWCDFEEMQNFFKAFLEQNDSFMIEGATLHPAADALETMSIETSMVTMNTGIIIVDDSVIEKSAAPIVRSYLNVDYVGDRDTTNAQLLDALEEAYGSRYTPGWPYEQLMTATLVSDQSVGLSTIIAYLAVYIGFVMLIACAAILALQQLSEAADNVSRYGFLAKIGAEKSLIDHALLIQIGVYFIFPLALALAHSYVAMSVLVQAIELFGHMQVFEPLLATTALAVIVYGGYFLVTYLASRSMVRPHANV